MKIGIIVYSKTGNTYSVAEKLKEKLSKDKNSVELERIETEEGSDINFKTLPKVDKYDVLIFASPVQAFNLSIVMSNYLKQLKLLDGKRVLCFVTEGFPRPWLGGTRAIKKMNKICKEKNGIIVGTGIVNWGSKKREEMINSLIGDFIELLK